MRTDRGRWVDQPVARRCSTSPLVTAGLAQRGRSRRASLGLPPPHPSAPAATPPGLTNGRHQPASRSSGATARAVTTSTAGMRRGAAPRPAPGRTTTLGRAPSSATPRQEGRAAQQRLDQGHPQVGPDAARAPDPGRPAPVPTSHTARPAGTSSATTAQFSRCRSHSRGTSRGPISPRSTPAVGQQLDVRRRPAASRAPKRSRAAAGGRQPGARFHVKPTGRSRRVSASRRQDDDVALRLDALGLADQAGGGHRVVHDLALERASSARSATGSPVSLTSLARPRGRARVELARRRRRGGRRCRASAGSARRSRGRPPAGSAPAAPRAPRRRARPAASRSPPTIETTRAVALDVHVDVAVEVGDVEQLLEVVRRDVALALEVRGRPGSGASPVRVVGRQPRRPRLDVRVVGQARRVASAAGSSTVGARLAAVDSAARSRVTPGSARLGCAGRTAARRSGSSGRRAARPAARRRPGSARRRCGRGPAGFLRGPLRLLRGLRAWAAGALARRVRRARLDGHAGLGRGLGGRVARPRASPAPRPPALPGRRVAPDHVELLAHRPQVRGQPVEQDTDREVDAGDGEEQREDVEQHLLLLAYRVVSADAGMFLHHQLALGGERRRRHQHDQDDGDDLGTVRAVGAR